MSLLGLELVTNGGFATDSDWTKESSWSIGSGVATRPSVADPGNSIYQTISISAGKTYRAVYTQIGTSFVGDGYISIGGTDGAGNSGIPSTYTEDIVAGSDGTVKITRWGTETISFDNVSVKEVSSASTIEEALFDMLRFDATIYGLVSSRIYPQIIPQNTSLPALEYEIISAPRGHHFTDMTDLVPARFQITAWSETYSNLRTISDAVRNAIDSLQETVGSVEIASCLMIDEVDLVETVPGADQLRRYGRALDFRITYREI
jgi:hypothetical protein